MTTEVQRDGGSGSADYIPTGTDIVNLLQNVKLFAPNLTNDMKMELVKSLKGDSTRMSQKAQDIRKYRIMRKYGLLPCSACKGLGPWKCWKKPPHHRQEYQDKV